MSRNKISKEIKLDAVLKILDGQSSVSTVAATLQVRDISVRTWLRMYQSIGIDAFDNDKNQAYSKELKLQAVTEYLSGASSQYAICKKFKIKSTRQLRNWISKYNNHEKLKSYAGGTGKVMVKGRKTTFEERIDIIKDYIESGSSYEEIAEKYSISYQQIYQWVRKYQEHGIDGLQDRRGKRKTPEDMTEIDRLRAELKMEQAKVKHLELENRVLKKLKEIERRRY